MLDLGNLNLGRSKLLPASGAVSSYLDGVISSVCCDLDATIAASYTSGQTWSNLIASPADGLVQTNYDFYLGADGTSSTDDPTFTGLAGDPAAYFALDGGDFFQGIDLTGTVLHNASKTSGAGSGPIWIAFAFQLGAIDANMAFMGNANANGQNGIRFLMNNTENLRMFQSGDAANFNQPIVPDATWAALTDYLFVVTMDSTAAGSEKYWINSTTGSAWNTAYSPVASTAESSNPFQIGSANGGFILPNNTRIYHFSCGNELLDDTKAGNIISHLETRHARDYTP